MIQKNEVLSSKDFSVGLVTRDDLLNSDFNQSPNCSDIKWYFDGAVGKRLGSSTTNSVAITPITAGNTGGWVLDTDASLSTSLRAYWRLDESSGTRQDAVGSLPLTDFTNVPSITGQRNQAVDSFSAAGSGLYLNGNSSLSAASGDFSLHCYVYFENTSDWVETQFVFTKLNSSGNTEYRLTKATSGGLQKLAFLVSTTDGGNRTVFSNSFGAITTGQFYSVAVWQDYDSHVGISVNLSTTTALTLGISLADSSGQLILGGGNTSSFSSHLQGRYDELGWWNKVLTAQERADLYGGGSGNTYAGSQAAGLATPWASFDFGASAIRWLTVAAGTGIMASSNRGTTFVNIASTRTLNYQYLERSKNVLIATSDSYDVPLYWAGSAGTFAITLAPNSAPGVKFSANFAGFTLLLNSATRKLGVFYADQNLQLTSTWTDSFDLPSSLDDEITGSFILDKHFYVHTRYFIFLVQFVGGNPDWTYQKVRDFGYVPRTVKIAYLKGKQVAVGLDWDGRLRIFDGASDAIISDNIENDNNYCDFATSKISRAGSGLIVSYAELDSVSQEYRIGLAVGAGTTETTHHLVLNTRTLAFYPYTNQPFNTMVMAESNRTRVLMAFDRSGYCHILNSGNLDVTSSIPEVYDSPLIYNDSPLNVSKSNEVDLFFKKSSSGTIYYQDRAEMRNVFSSQIAMDEIKSTDSSILLRRSVNLPSVQNIHQFRLTSSGNTVSTANPWKLVRIDYMSKNLGFGKGGVE